MAIKVLAVDDSPFIREEIKALLEDTDYEVVCVSKDGPSALDDYQAHQPDVVTLDIVMPGMDGMDTARLMLERWPDAKIIVVSSLAYDNLVGEAMDLGAKEFLYKPFGRAQLVEALDKALGRNQA